MKTNHFNGGMKAELINFCFLELDNTDLNNLSPIERYYLFTASKHLRFKYILNLHTTVLFSPQPLYEDIENKYVFHSYSNEDIPLSEIPNDIIKQIKGNAKVIVVNKCETVQDFCFFELYTLLSNNFLEIILCLEYGLLIYFKIALSVWLPPVISLLALKKDELL